MQMSRAGSPMMYHKYLKGLEMLGYIKNTCRHTIASSATL
jgi:hypothetical protein